MKNKNDEAFLKSVVGAMPIKKKNTLRKNNILKQDLTKKKAPITNIKDRKIEKTKKETKKNKSFFEIEKPTINKRLKKRKISISKKIDFHGMGVLDAEELFLKTIINCFQKNQRCILFVTGKGILNKNTQIAESTKLYYGKIRNSFSSWVKKEEISRYILSYEQASVEYGADGAFFVYLRKQKN